MAPAPWDYHRHRAGLDAQSRAARSATLPCPALAGVGEHVSAALGDRWRDNATVDDVPAASGAHVVLPAADAEPYASLRRRPTPRAERYRLGRRLRKDVPRSALGAWEPWPGRPDV